MRPSRLLPCLVLLAASPALAEPDTFGVGTGRSGAAIHSGTGPVNAYTGISANVAIGNTAITVQNSGAFAVGDLVLLWQPTGLTNRPTANTNVDLSGERVGAWEFGRVATTSAGRVNLTVGTVNAYTSGRAQVVRVPEYTDLTVLSGQTITATPWNGTSGGIVVFLVNGTLTLAGDVSASGAGFRGGVATDHDDDFGCTADSGSINNGYAPKGEGVFPQDYASNDLSRGKAAIANGGGGGICHNSGGGGGGHATAGGKGGGSYDGNRDVGGRGGGSLNDGLPARLVPGGGGGAGEVNNSVGTSGAAGGGVIFIRVQTMDASSTGNLLAEGATASNAGDDGAGGGGAGGSIIVRAVERLACTRASVRGGNGGNATSDCGAGGGGAGGRLFLQGQTKACAPDVTAGGSGTGTNGRSGENGGVGLNQTVPAGGYCYSDASCLSGGVCDLAVNGCVQCLDDASCSGSTPICDTTHACRPCSSANGEEDCQPLFCNYLTVDPMYGMCVECIESTHCASDRVCDPMTNTCKECVRSTDCENPKPICDLPTNKVCRECKASSECPAGSPVCDLTGSFPGNCVACSPADPSRCTGATPACDSTSDTCVKCLGDLGTKVAAPCHDLAAPACHLGDALDGQCTECSATNHDRCTGYKLACVLATGLCGCNDDGECGTVDSGRVCPDDHSACAAGCRGVGGNGCPTGLVCTSTTAAVGNCIPMPPDAGTPGPDAAQPGPDAAQPGLDAAQPGPDAAQPGLDAAQPGPDAAQPGLDAAQPGPDAAQPGLDAGQPGLDAAGPGLDAAEPGLDAAQADAAEPDASSRPDAAEPGADAEVQADASEPGDSGAPDAAKPADGSVPVDGSVVKPTVPSYDVGGCGCGSSGGLFPLLGFALVGLRRRQRRG